MRRFCFSSLLVALLLTACTDARDKDNFVLQGTVAEGVGDVRYLLYIIDDYGHIQLDVPVDTLEIRDGQFSFAMHIEEPVGGLLKGVHQDGNTDFQFKEFWAIPGDTCVLRVTGCRYDEMEVHGGVFYAQYNAFKAYRDSLFQPVLEKGMELNSLSSEHPQDKAAFQQLTDELERLDEVYRRGIQEYNREHGKEEGCAIYQLQWLINNHFDFSLVDSTIANGRFRKYVEYRRSQYLPGKRGAAAP